MSETIRRFTPVLRGKAVVLGVVALLAFVAPLAGTPQVAGAVETYVEPQTLASVNGVLEATLTCEPTETTVAGQKVTAWMYNGSYIPPTLKVKPGDTIRLKLVNKIPTTTNIHTHGLNVSPLGNSDNVFVHVAPGASFDYEIKIPADHPSGLYYYHPHAHGTTEFQTFSGMSGMLVVDGVLDPFPQLAGIRHRVMALKDIQVTNTGTIPKEIDSGAGTTRTVNGVVNPLMVIRPNEVQLWSLANIAPDIFYRLQLDGHTMYEISRDGNRHNQIVPRTEILLPPASRIEFLVKGGQHGIYQLRTLAMSTGPQGDSYPEVPLATLVSEGTPSADIALPSTLPAVRDLRNDPVAHERTVVFSETADGNTFFINGKEFDINRIDTTVRLGDTERWTIRNNSDELHVFHIHQLDFQVVDVNGQPQPFVGHQDTITTPVRGSVTVLIPFTNPIIVGKFVYHCHIMAHEDNGMMAVIEVVDPARPARAGATRTDDPMCDPGVLAARRK